MTTTSKVCKDCRAEGKLTGRPVKFPGPRCYTHHHERRRAVRLAGKVRRTEQTYNLSREKYDALYAAQGGRCALCRRSRGTGGKRLAVDHDHACCIGPTSCGKCVRGLVCSTCNDVLAHARDDRAFFVRGHDYLVAWPSRVAGIVPWAV